MTPKNGLLIFSFSVPFSVSSSFFILHSSFFILHSSFFILHSSFFILHSSFFILHSSFFLFFIFLFLFHFLSHFHFSFLFLFHILALYGSLTKDASSAVGASWRCGVLTTQGGRAGIGLGHLLEREHDSTPQSGVEAPRLLKLSLSRLYYCC